MGPFRALVALIGAAFIHVLMRTCGRTVRESSVPWLSGPIGADYIGDKPYEEVAARENLALVRRSVRGGLVPDVGALNGPEFRAERLRPEVRHFYEHTAMYRMDVWSETFFPGKIGLWLLVTTISRKVNQLNFPLRALATAKGMDSEIVLLEDHNGIQKHRLVSKSQTPPHHPFGFYTAARAPLAVIRASRLCSPCRAATRR